MWCVACPWPSRVSRTRTSRDASIQHGSIHACATAHARSAYLRSARRHHFLADEAFVLRHFAGDVLYVSAAARHATLKGKGAAGAQAGGGRLERSTAAYEVAAGEMLKRLA